MSHLEPSKTDKASRTEVYRELNREREYQVERWKDSCCKGTEHTVTEFLVYMRDYVEEALHTLSREAEPAATNAALHTVRKVTALGVACMERHGALTRPEALK